MSKPNISQSLIKRLWDYKEGHYCGLALKSIDIDKLYKSPSSPAMLKGLYFEYLATGGLTRDGEIPDKPRTATGGISKTDIKRAQDQSERFRANMKHHGIVIHETGTKLSVGIAGHNATGILDVLGERVNKPVIVDVKYSGLIGNKWEDYAWEANTFNLRDKLTIQVVFYKWLAKHDLGIEDIPFYFAVHSSTNNVDSLVWQVILSDYDGAMQEMTETIKKTALFLENAEHVGYTARPDVAKCAKCAVTECPLRIEVPPMMLIEIEGKY